MITGLRCRRHAEIRKELLGPGPEYNAQIDGTWFPFVTG